MGSVNNVDVCFWGNGTGNNAACMHGGNRTTEMRSYRFQVAHSFLRETASELKSYACTDE